ncbi:MAG: hypothetical protein IKP58_18765 [Victivallales bacterium]|nr:hypothetical protein [Victivallales bacterium]
MAERLANAEQLKLYFSIGAYVSFNSRKGKWGTGAIEAISKRLQVELPGLRGFSARSIKYMRTFLRNGRDYVTDYCNWQLTIWRQGKIGNCQLPIWLTTSVNMEHCPITLNSHCPMQSRRREPSAPSKTSICWTIWIAITLSVNILKRHVISINDP